MRLKIILNKKQITFFGKQYYLVCDGKCDKAWGINWKGKKKKKAPRCTGNREGGYGKPNCYDKSKLMNKWCTRECERSDMIPLVDEEELNIKWKRFIMGLIDGDKK